jgi:hypothetical protein
MSEIVRRVVVALKKYRVDHDKDHDPSSSKAGKVLISSEESRLLTG